MTDAVLDALWKKVLDDWENEHVHGAFIDHCQTTGQLLEAAVRYRGMAGDHLRGAAADKRLKAIALVAMTNMESQRSEPPRDYSDVVKLVLILFFVAGSIALMLALRR